jgi:hypothetical protein
MACTRGHKGTTPQASVQYQHLICEAYGGAVKITANIEDPVVIKQILAPLQRKAESKELYPLPESRVSAMCRSLPPTNHFSVSANEKADAEKRHLGF